MPGLIRPAAAANEFKIGLFIALSGPASLFGPTQCACAELAAEQINEAGGFMGRRRPARGDDEIGDPPHA
jgi:ABC-type branched-subunit amino acid transport system substrate-binding protein